MCVVKCQRCLRNMNVIGNLCHDLSVFSNSVNRLSEVIHARFSSVMINDVWNVSITGHVIDVSIAKCVVSGVSCDVVTLVV